MSAVRARCCEVLGDTLGGETLAAEGFLVGLCSLLDTILGIPIASLSERGNRPMIIGSAIAVWRGFTALCGLAQSYWQLVLARVGVGVGTRGRTSSAGVRTGGAVQRPDPARGTTAPACGGDLCAASAASPE